MTTHVFGMAKSSLDLKGAKRQKLELDLLRLSYACNNCLGLGENARGYLAVATEEIKKQVDDWQKQYGIPSSLVAAFVPDLAELELAALQAEKVRNRAGNLSKAVRSGTLPDADGSVGKVLMEGALVAHIARLAAHVNKIEAVASHVANPLLLNIKWDFYALYDGPLPPLPPSD